MLTTNRNLLRSTPDLTCFPSTTRNMPNDQWRTSSGSSLHRSRSSRTPRSSTRSASRENSSNRGGSRKAPAVSIATTNRDTLSATTTPVRRAGTVRHNRSQSFRNVRTRSPQPNRREALDAEGFRSRGSTMPSNRATSFYIPKKRPEPITVGDVVPLQAASLPVYEPEFKDDEECYLLRIFSITPKGNIACQGNYVKQRPRRSSNSVASTSSTGENETAGTSATSTTHCVTTSRGPARRIILLGSSGAGKTSLVTGFMTTEYLNAYDTQDEELEKTVSVLLDGVEYDLFFIDNPLAGRNTGGDMMDEEGDAYVIVYSVTERQTFEKAVDILFGLKERNLTSNKAVILVGNKSDLARSREVSNQEGKAIASSYECKFIETSAYINHNVDELLVGIVSQIRLKAEPKLDRKKNKTLKVTSSPLRKWGSTKASLRSSLKSRGIINKLLGKGPKKSKSCENLHIL